MKIKSLEDPKFLNYVFDPPSLKNIAITAIAVRMYGCPHDDYHKFVHSKETKHYKAALQRLENIPLPQLLKQQILNVIESIQLEWLGWIDTFHENGYGKYCDLKEFYEIRGLSYWTMEGTVNVVKLLEDIFEEVKAANNKDIDYRTLYKTACLYCMEDYVSEFWIKFPNYHYSFKHSEERSNPFLAYWSASLRNEADTNHIKNMISESIRCGNSIAFKYFWNHKLTEREKSFYIKEWIVLVFTTIRRDCNNNYFCDRFPLNYYHFLGNQKSKSLTYIMRFLLTHLGSHSDQKEIFESYPDVILPALFFHSPFKRYFLSTFTVMLDFLKEKMYIQIISSFFETDVQGTDMLLNEMWDISPPNLKKSFLEYLKINGNEISGIRNITTRLILNGNVMTINSILSNLAEDDKRQILFRVVKLFDIRIFFELYTNSDKMAVSTIDTIASKNLSENDCHLFKLLLISNFGKELCNAWILKTDIASFNIFWDWCCQFLNKFKEKHINLENLGPFLTRYTSFKHVKEFLNWYFEKEKEINELNKSFVFSDYFIYCYALIEIFHENEIKVNENEIMKMK